MSPAGQFLLGDTVAQVAPLVSVLIPTWNRMALLREALLSVQRQTMSEEQFEILVCDDGSTDGTPEEVERYFPQVRLLRSPQRGGSGAARNRLIAEARGEFCAFLDDDDVWKPDFLERQVGTLRASPQAALSFCRHGLLSSTTSWPEPDLTPGLRYSNLREFLVTECFIHSMSLVMCRREVALAAGPLKSELTVLHDLEWYLRMLARGTFAYIPEELVLVRVHASNLSQQQASWIREEMGWLASQHGTRRQRAYRYLFHAGRAARRGDLPLAARCALESILLSPATAAAVGWRKAWRRPDRQKELAELKRLGLLIDAATGSTGSTISCGNQDGG